MAQQVVNEASQFQIAHTVPFEHLADLSDIEFEKIQRTGDRAIKNWIDTRLQ